MMLLTSFNACFRGCTMAGCVAAACRCHMPIIYPCQYCSFSLGKEVDLTSVMYEPTASVMVVARSA